MMVAVPVARGTTIIKKVGSIFDLFGSFLLVIILFKEFLAMLHTSFERDYTYFNIVMTDIFFIVFFYIE